MKLEENAFLKRLKAGTPQPGMWISLNSNFAAGVLADAGFDWVLVDMEHSPNEISDVLSQFQAFGGSGTVTLARPQWNDSVIIKRLLDAGAQGVIVPMVQNAQEAAKAVAACRYPPRGVRGVSLSQRGTKYGRITDYFQRIEDELAIIVQVETKEALGNVEEIAAVDGVSAVFFGPADISADFGFLGNPMEPSVWTEIHAAKDKVKAMGVGVGTLVGDANFAADLMKQGYDFVSIGTDASLLSKAAADVLKIARASIDT